MIPGEIIPAAGEIELNSGRIAITLKVANSGDRPIQVGSHYHFAETNPAPVKYATSRLGFGSAECRLPMAPSLSRRCCPVTARRA